MVRPPINTDHISNFSDSVHMALSKYVPAVADFVWLELRQFSNWENVDSAESFLC